MPKPRPAEEVWWIGLKWTQAAHMQAERFEEAVSEQVAAETDADMRRRLNDDSEHSRSWRESYDRDYQPYDPQRPLRVPTWALHVQVSAEVDLLIVALRNVLRAQARLPVKARTSMGDQDLVRLLRNIAEHWNERGGDSEVELAERYPTVMPDAFAYTNKEIWIGGLHGVPLSRIRAWLYRVEKALRECLGQKGVEVPGDWMASRAPGDDELPWPSERLRYHWSIPQVPEEEWPREEMPEEIAKLLAQRFANLRRRDHTD